MVRSFFDKKNHCKISVIPGPNRPNVGSGVTILVHLLFFSFPLCKLSPPFCFKFLDFYIQKENKSNFLICHSEVMCWFFWSRKNIMPLIVSQESLCLQYIHSDKMANIFQLLYPVERSFKDCYIVIFFIFLFNNWLSKVWAGSVINKWNL